MKLLISLTSIIAVIQMVLAQDIILKTKGRIAEHTPHHCLIRRDYTMGGGPYYYNEISAGSIISPKYILTAANMLYYDRNYSNYTVGVGSNRKDQLLYYEVEETFMHPEFYFVQKRWAFGVLQLKHSLTFTSFIQPIALPPLGAHGPHWQEQGRIHSFDEDTGILNVMYQRVTNDPEEIGGFDTTFYAQYEDFDFYENCGHIVTGSGLIVKYFGVDTIMGLSIIGRTCYGGAEYYARVTAGRQWIHEQFGI